MTVTHTHTMLWQRLICHWITSLLFLFLWELKKLFAAVLQMEYIELARYKASAAQTSVIAIVSFSASELQTGHSGTKSVRTSMKPCCCKHVQNEAWYRPADISKDWRTVCLSKKPNIHPHVNASSIPSPVLAFACFDDNSLHHLWNECLFFPKTSWIVDLSDHRTCFHCFFVPSGPNGNGVCSPDLSQLRQWVCLHFHANQAFKF